MNVIIEDVRITRFDFPRSRVVGDSQVCSDANYVATVELICSTGQIGLGAFASLFTPLPSQAELMRVFDAEVRSGIVGRSPYGLLNRMTRPRGGNIRNSIFQEAVNIALWDLQAQLLDLPLYRLLGGENNRVPAYASGLCFHLDDAAYTAFYRAAYGDGFRAFKIKVGHPDLDWDLHRLKLLKDVVGDHSIIMVDANEAWSPKEAIRRITAYNAAGHVTYWVEDPCLRHDFAGLREIRQALPETFINAGEYLSVAEKYQLMDGNAVDVLNVHGHISDVRRAGWMAAERGVPLSLGNTIFESGIHSACSLPDVIWMEYAYLDWNLLLEDPIRFVNGYAIAPERSGHGLKISEHARRTYAQE